MKKLFLMSLLACTLGVFTSCSSDDETTATTGDKTTPTETTESFGEVLVKVNNTGARAAASRAASENLGVKDVTATFVSPIDGTDYFVVTYHGRNQADAGMVQIVKADGTVVSELTTLNARVNTAAYDKVAGAVYIGLDKSNSTLSESETETTKLASGYHCAIAKVTLTSDNKFPEISSIAESKIFGLNGVSVNCIAVPENGGKVYIATSTGTVSFGKVSSRTYNGGYWKIDPTKSENIETPSTDEEVSSNGKNWAAYWYSLSGDYRVKVRRDAAHSADCHATLYKGTGSTEIAVADYTSTNSDDSDNQYGRTSAAYLTIGGTDYLFTCGDELTAWTLNDGKFVNMNDGTLITDHTTKPITYEKQYVSGSYTTAVATDGKYLYACTGSAVSKYELRTYNQGENAGKTRFVIAGKFNAKDQTGDNWKTESNSLASANHLIVKDGKVYVAFGYKGFVALDATNDFKLTPKTTTEESK